MEDTRSNRSQGSVSFTSYVKHKKSGKLDSLSQQSVVLPRKRQSDSFNQSKSYTPSAEQVSYSQQLSQDDIWMREYMNKLIEIE